MFFFEMERKDKVAEVIRNIIKELMDNVMDKVLVGDPFVAEAHHAKKPMYAALVPDEIFKGSHFERRFVTPFGHVWEKLAACVAEVCHGSALTEHNISGTIGEKSLKRIAEVLNRLEHSGKNGKYTPDWEKELAYVKAGGGNPLPVTVTCDLFIESQSTGKRYAFELKAPLPNSDQTKVSKEKIFKLLVMNEHPVDEAYYALVYNPYGRKEDYAWSFPRRWFDMRHDSCVLIGNELWNLIGGEGTYQNFVSELNALGAEYKERIYREYLGIEPPVNFDKAIWK